MTVLRLSVRWEQTSVTILSPCSGGEIEHSHAVDEFACLRPDATGDRTPHVFEPGLPKLSDGRLREFEILGIRRTGEASVDQMRDRDVALVFGQRQQQLVIEIVVQ